MKELLAYHNKESLKEKYVKRMQEHIKADELVHGEGWDSETGKGCAVGCTLNKYNHACYQDELGLPEWLAQLEDTLFENMSKEKSKTFPLEFLQAIPVGKKDWNNTFHKFCIFVLEDSKKNVKAEFDYVISAIDKVIDYHLKSIVGFENESAAESAARSAARSAAESAAESAWSAWSARSAAESAAESAARSAAESAARSAAESAAESARSAAESAARSARSAARSAESAAWSAWSARSAAWSARSAAESAARSAWSAESAAFDRYADNLIELLKETNVTEGIS